MKKYFAFLLIIPLLLSCEKNNNTDDSSFWVPDIRLEKGNGSVDLYLTDPRPYTEYVTRPPSNPDLFEIYYSDNRSSFTMYSKADYTENKITIQGVENKKPYYFYVRTSKDGLQPVNTDTLMVVPSELTEADVLSEEYSFSGINASLSYNHSYISFTSNNFLYYKPLDDRIINYIDQMTTAPVWSPSTNTLAYVTYTNVGLWLYPFRLKTYNCDTKNAVILSEIDYSKYYISTPVFSKDGNTLSFLSSENNSKKEFYDIWTIDINSKTKSRLTSFENTHFIIQGSYDWSTDGTEIFLSGYFENGTYRSKLYKYNIGEARLTPILETDWSDVSPTLSPDYSKIAFISNRSGDDEVWIFNRNSSEYQMITGSSEYNFDARYSGIQWISNNEIVISAYHNNTSEVLKFTVD
jgi:Tol biopolymer transport system component